MVDQFLTNFFLNAKSMSMISTLTEIDIFLTQILYTKFLLKIESHSLYYRSIISNTIIIHIC